MMDIQTNRRTLLQLDTSLDGPLYMLNGSKVILSNIVFLSLKINFVLS